MAAFAAFYDANVLYPAELRSLLMHLAITDLFRAKWSAEVHEEWIANLLVNRPDLTRMQLERTRDLMDTLIPCVHLPHPGDRHILCCRNPRQGGRDCDNEPQRLSRRGPRRIRNRGTASG